MDRSRVVDHVRYGWHTLGRERGQLPFRPLDAFVSLPFVRTWSVARGLVEAGDSASVRFAVCHREGEPVIGSVGARPAESPVGWLCGGKPVLAYAALRAAEVSGVGVDDDLRGHVPTAPDCPPITLREVLTYRSGLVRTTEAGTLPCFTDPPLSRARDWNSSVDAEYWSAGWDLLPVLTAKLTGVPYERFLRDEVLVPEFGMVTTAVRRDLAAEHVLAHRGSGEGIRRVMSSDEFATSLGGPLSDLARFYRGVAAAKADDLDGRSAASILTSDNPGPRFFGRGISPHLRWALGFPALLIAQGFERIADAEAFGAMGAALTLTPEGLRYAWVTVAGALPTVHGTFAVSIQGVRQVPDARYLLMVRAVQADLQKVSGG